jgi:hypothetical protein
MYCEEITLTLTKKAYEILVALAKDANVTPSRFIESLAEEQFEQPVRDFLRYQGMGVFKNYHYVITENNTVWQYQGEKSKHLGKYISREVLLDGLVKFGFDTGKCILVKEVEM